MKKNKATSAQMSKRIVLLVTVERSAINFYNGYASLLLKQGWEVTVVASSTGRLERWAEDEGVRSVAINYARNPSILDDLKKLWQTIQVFKTIKPTVVVSATPKAGLLGMLASFLTRVPVRIYQIWGLRFETETGRKRKILVFLEKLAIHCSTQTLANSRSLIRVIENNAIASRGRVEVLGPGSSHGVDLQRFSTENGGTLDLETLKFLGETNPSLTVLFVGRITKDKGIGTLLAALKIATERGEHLRAIFVGPSEDNTFGDLVDGLPIDRVHNVGQVSDTRPYMHAADVLCLPTLREGFPNVVLEASAVGLPAIVSNATGAIDSVVEGETGWIFEVGDAERLANILIELSRAPQKIREFGVNARHFVQANFDQNLIWKLQIDNIEEQFRAHNMSKEKRDATRGSE